jgi:hypothetical protein
MSSAVRAKQVLHGRIFLASGSARLKCAARRLVGLFSPHDVVCQITTESVNRRALSGNRWIILGMSESCIN